MAVVPILLAVVPIASAVISLVNTIITKFWPDSKEAKNFEKVNDLAEKAEDMTKDIGEALDLAPDAKIMETTEDIQNVTDAIHGNDLE
ncbi:MAG: hypothetical protein HRU35_05830 [Rickettsiaceae bacterium]|nr:hypothetical protein [Rickettsiaceae bacterium]